MVPSAPLVALDVLEFRANHAGDDVLHLLRDTGVSGSEKVRGTQFRRFSICQCGPGDGASRVRTRRKAGLVALRSVQCPVGGRIIVSVVRAGAAPAQPESPRGYPVRAAIEYAVTRHGPVPVSILPGDDDHPGPTIIVNTSLRAGADRAGSDLERCAPATYCVYRGATAAGGL